jgi:dihydroceramide fatty acyl 2-hydroxylase
MADIFPASSEKDSIRIFESDFLEFFTHIHPAVIVVIWLPVGLYFLLSAIATVQVGVPVAAVPLGLLIGIFLWSFIEYTLHRFLFHFTPRNPTQERLAFLFHGVHHLRPQDKTRLVMPPIVSVPLALLFYGLMHLVVVSLLGTPGWLDPIFAGFVFGYLTYDLTHYATHHFPMRAPVLRYLKRYHMMHHYKTPDARFGVSSPLWDIVFGTKPD